MSEEKIAKKQVADHRPLHEVVFVILDLETSGAAPSTGAGITEIGAVKVRGGEIIGEFQTFVNPQHGLSDFITSLTGITDDMLADAPKIKSVLPDFFEFLGSHKETVLVAHNAPFDLACFVYQQGGGENFDAKFLSQFPLWVGHQGQRDLLALHKPNGA